MSLCPCCGFPGSDVGDLGAKAVADALKDATHVTHLNLGCVLPLCKAFSHRDHFKFIFTDVCLTVWNSSEGIPQVTEWLSKKGSQGSRVCNCLPRGQGIAPPPQATALVMTAPWLWQLYLWPTPRCSMSTCTVCGPNFAFDVSVYFIAPKVYIFLLG